MYCYSVLFVLVLCVLSSGGAASEKPAIIFWHGFDMSYNDITSHFKPRTYVQAMRDLATSFYGVEVVDPPVYSVAIGHSFSEMAPPRLYDIERELKEEKPGSDRLSSLQMDLFDQVDFGVKQLLHRDIFTYISKNGFIAVGVSLGGVMWRAVLQQSEILISHCFLFVSVGSPHEGISVLNPKLIPKSDIPIETSEDLELFLKTQTPFKHLTRDPRTRKLRAESLLAVINDPIAACNLLRLRAFVMYKFTDDKIVRAPESQHMMLDSSLAMLDIAVVRITITGGHLDFTNSPGWTSDLAALLLSKLSEERDPHPYLECLKQRANFHKFFSREAKQNLQKQSSTSKQKEPSGRMYSSEPLRQREQKHGGASMSQLREAVKQLAPSANPDAISRGAVRMQKFMDHVEAGVVLNRKERMVKRTQFVPSQQLLTPPHGGYQNADKISTTE